ncbi:MAG: gamma-glutamylcyclotransferase [Acidiferrobacteraceae bacterium]|nr:gamma-glutamylcyclotransferase [Acidiferrobacteraceae bacterium]
MLTRQSILEGAVQRLAELSGDTGPWLSDTQRKTILRNLIRNIDTTQGIWLFGYGSLMWNPAINFSEKKVGIAYGYHRSFCLWSTIGRGTVDNPGLMLALKHGGSCRGLLYKIDPEHIDSELDIVLQRELVTLAYRPIWLSTICKDQLRIPAISFAIDVQHPRYSGSLDKNVTARIISEAKGALGSCSEYLYKTAEQLEQLKIPDKNLSYLVTQVRKIEKNSGYQ